MERAIAAKEQQRQYLISKGEKIPEPGPSKTEESKTKCSCVRFFARYCLLLYDYVSIGVANSTIETFRCGGWKS